MSLNINQELETLRDMTVRELRQRYRKVWGEETRSHSKAHLVKRIAWKLQADAEGFSGFPETVMARARELADFAFLRTRPPSGTEAVAHTTRRTCKRLPSHDLNLPPAGTVLRREYRGRVLECRVLEHGFEFDGDVYRSLSGAARAATGVNWNGKTFWGLKGARD